MSPGFEGGAELGPDGIKLPSASDKFSREGLGGLNSSDAQTAGQSLSIDTLPLPGSSYTVQPGNTLWDISEQVLQIGGNKKPSELEIRAEMGEITRANPQFPDLLNDPQSLQSGSELSIPQTKAELLLPPIYPSDIVRNKQDGTVDFRSVAGSQNDQGAVSTVNADGTKTIYLPDGTVDEVDGNITTITNLSSGLNATIDNGITTINTQAQLPEFQAAGETGSPYLGLNSLGTDLANIYYPNNGKLMFVNDIDQQGQALITVTTEGIPGLTQLQGAPCLNSSMNSDGSGSFVYADQQGNPVTVQIDQTGNLILPSYIDKGRMQAE